MKGKWKVSNNPAMGDMPYIVYRLRDTEETDHSGNRQFCGNYTADKKAAQELADKLNTKYGGGGK